MEPDIRLSAPQPVRLVAPLEPGAVIAQGASAELVIEAPGLETLRARAEVSGTTADLEFIPVLADKETEATTDVPAAVNLAADTETSVDVTPVGEDLWIVRVTNTGAGPDVTIGFIDLFPSFKSPRR